jgi:2OG-Fe dioxygenase
VSDESTGAPPSLEDAWATLDRQGYALTNDRALGLPEGLREDFHKAYFNSSVLRRDPGDMPKDRQRARDVIRYQWRCGALDMEEHDSITITNRSGMPGKRDHARVRFLEDPQAASLVRAFLSLVPPGRRQADGTFDINLFRTFTNVVSGPHCDDEQFCVIYLLSRMGGGAETYLYERGDFSDRGEPTAGPIFKHQLNPGEIIIFEDKRFKHGATPLAAPPGGTAMRDAVVCTVDYRETYLAGAGLN